MRAEITIRFDVPEDVVRPGILDLLVNEIKPDIKELGKNTEVEARWVKPKEAKEKEEDRNEK